MVCCCNTILWLVSLCLHYMYVHTSYNLPVTSAYNQMYYLIEQPMHVPNLKLCMILEIDLRVIFGSIMQWLFFGMWQNISERQLIFVLLAFSFYYCCFEPFNAHFCAHWLKQASSKKFASTSGFLACLVALVAQVLISLCFAQRPWPVL